MATVNKDFKVKNGLIVEGTTAKVNNYDILTKKQADQDYIVGLIGGTSTSANTPDTVVKRDGSGNFAAGTITANLTGNVTGTVSSLSNHDTGDLAEGSRLYFTDERAVDANTGLWDTIGAAAQAEADAILAAQQYTDGEISDEILARDAAIGVALTSAENYADSAAGNAESAAITAANSHTDSQIALEATRADAYADGAASSALTSANGYTDSAISSEVTRSNNYADGVGTSTLGLANGYTDTAISSEVTRSNNYADAAEAAAIAAAESYTDGEIVTALATAAADATTKADAALVSANAYTDNAVAGLDWKTAAHVLYADATPALSGSSPLTIDGHLFTSAEDGLRVLVTSGNDGGADAGIYVYNHGATWTLTRATDADAFAELKGAAIYISEGTQFGGTSWVQNNPYITDFSGQGWTQFAGQGSVTAGYGIVVDGLEVSIDQTVTATRAFATSEAADAEDAAIAHTNSEISTEVTNRNNAIATAKSEAITSSNGYTDTAISTEVTNRNSAIATAKSEAISSSNGYTDSSISTEVTNRNSAIATAKSEAINAAEDYTDTAISTEVTNRNNAIATAKSEAISTSNDYADGLVADEILDRNNAINNAINALDTDDIEEGITNLYFESGRAKTAAAELLVNATKTNIQITGTGAGLTITAENGVADSNTDQLTEGSTNLYFTDERAVLALEAVVPNFTEVDINSLATQVAATVAVPTASQVPAYSFAKADYSSAEFLVKTAYGNHTEISKVLLTLDVNDNIAITEYGTVGTNGASMTISADVDGANVRLLVTTANNSSTVTVVGTLLA